MKVSDCRKCRYFRELKWTETRRAQGYEDSFISHSFGFCHKHRKKCREVRRCAMAENPKTQMELVRE
jgi:hypothetical protein